MLTTFDPNIGEEVFLLLKEEPGYADTYGQVSPLTLLASSGLTRTPFGIVPYVVWTVAAQSPAETQFEHFLNPTEMSSLRLLAAAASQSHFKMVIVNCVTSEVTAFVDYENVFGLGELAEAIVATMGHEPDGEFQRAVEHVKANVTLNVLLGNSAA
jgi:hypothetical protein